MKLIEFLVSKGREGWCWPNGITKAAVMLGGGAVSFFYNDSLPPALSETLISPRYFRDHECVTREQYEAALAASKEMIINKPDSDGWISWCGGECPVDGDVVVDVKFRAQGQADLDGDVADNFRWEHFSNGADVVAYRLHKSGHQKPEWDGEGLPPVGFECMVRGEIGDDGWYECKVIAHTFFDGYNCAVFQTESTVSCSSEGYFRPIRSEADKKKEAVLSQIANAIIGDVPDTGMATAAMYAERIYGAIKSGKIVID